MVQDIILAVVAVALGLALIPQLIYGFKTKKGLIEIKTGTITSLGLYTVAITFYTLDLIFSSIVNFFVATLWAILLIQRVKYGKIK